jgi:probable addiction module antidote protein
MPTTNFKKYLLKQLRNTRYAAGYLTAALDEGDDVFLLALRDVVQAQIGVAALSRATKLNRENLYDMLSRRGNPRLRNIRAILDRLGFELSLRPKPKRARAA